MAISIISKPKLYCPAHWLVEWQFSMSDLGTPPDRKDFGFALYDGSGTRITEDAKYKPVGTGVNFAKDFKSIAQGLVYTSFPTDGAGMTTDSNILKKVKVKYGEVTFVGTEPCSSSKAINADTPVINLINSNANAETHSLFGNDAGYTGGRTGLMLTQRPRSWTLYHGSKDYIWFLGAGNIVATWYNGATNLGNVSWAFTGADSVKYVCLDYTVHGITAKPTHATVFVSDGVDEITYRIYYRSCTEQDKYMGVLFLEPLGGRSMFATGIAESIDLEKSGTISRKRFDYTQTQHKTGHNTMIYPSGSRKVSFQTQLENSSGVERWIQNFASSAGYHVQRGYGANTKWEKFILDTGSVNVVKRDAFIDVSFAGIISEPINVQSEDV